MTSGFDTQLPTEKSIHDKEPKPRKESSSKKKHIPTGLFLLAFFCLLLGGLGVLFQGKGLVVDLTSEEQTFDEFYMEFHTEFRNLPPDVAQKLEDFTNSEMLEKIFNASNKGLKEFFPNLWLYQFASLGFSLLSFLGGLGVFMRRDWGRQSLIALFILTTAVISVAGYMVIPATISFVSLLAAETGANSMVNLDMEAISSVATTVWTALVVLFVVLHGLIVWYLMSQSIKDIFREEPVSGGYFG